MLRPGNAGANTVADHVVVLDAPSPSCRPRSPSGHRAGDDAALVTRPSSCAPTRRAAPRASCGPARARNVGFFVVARSNAQVHSAIFDTVGLEEIWEPALTRREPAKEQRWPS